MQVTALHGTMLAASARLLKLSLQEHAAPAAALGRQISQMAAEFESKPTKARAQRALLGETGETGDGLCLQDVIDSCALDEGASDHFWKASIAIRDSYRLFQLLHEALDMARQVCCELDGQQLKQLKEEPKERSSLNK